MTRPSGAATRGAVASILGDAVPAVAPTIVVVVRRHGRVVHEAALGLVDDDRRARPATPDLRFDLASITKTFIATCVLGLVTDGRLGLDEPVSDVIPGLVAGDRPIVDGGQDPFSRAVLAAPPERQGWSVDAAAITIRQLLAHTSGLAPWRAIFEVVGPPPPTPPIADPRSPEERWERGIDAVRASALVDRPGRAVAYSDLGYMLLGEALRRATGMPIDAVLAERVTEPLGLTSIGYAPLRAGVTPHAIVPTSIDAAWRGRRCWGEVEDENAAGMGGVSGHAGLFGTAQDVARFGQAWLERDPRLGIAPELMEAAVHDQTGVVGGRRGLGWMLHPGPDPGRFLEPLGPASHGHTGFTGTSLAIDPGRQLVVALLANRVHDGRSTPGIDALRRALHAALTAD